MYVVTHLVSRLINMNNPPRLCEEQIAARVRVNICLSLFFFFRSSCSHFVPAIKRLKLLDPTRLFVFSSASAEILDE